MLTHPVCSADTPPGEGISKSTIYSSLRSLPGFPSWDLHGGGGGADGVGSFVDAAPRMWD